MVEGTALEMRQVGFRCEGSNPSISVSPANMQGIFYSFSFCPFTRSVAFCYILGRHVIFVHIATCGHALYYTMRMIDKGDGSYENNRYEQIISRSHGTAHP